MRVGRSRWIQLSLVALTIVGALVLGYVTAKLTGSPSAAPPLEVAIPDTLDVLGAETETPAETIEAAASTTALPTVTPARTATPRTTPISPAAIETTTAEATPADVFIDESFSSPDRGWPTNETSTWSARLVDGRYQLTLNGQTYVSFTTPIPAQNYRLSVDVSVREGGAGVVFLYGEPAITYRILLSPDGAYSIERQEENSATRESSVTKIVEWTESAALRKTPGEPNRLRIERVGAEIRFFANDEPLTTFSVPPGNFTNRYGFVLTARSGQGQASFDNLLGERLP